MLIECENFLSKLGLETKGVGRPVYIIAEIGSNHGCSMDKAKELIFQCGQQGANAVKFQSWTAHKLQNIKQVNKDGSLSISTVLPILQKFELQEDWHAELSEYCRAQGVDFLSTPFDVDRARLLKKLGVPAIKIASSDIVYDELLDEVAGYGLPILLSTGMANLAEIERAVKILGQTRSDIVLLHCVGAYPPDHKDANLLSLQTMANTFGLPVGLSDHYPGHDMVLAAIALGACVVEKHVTLSKNADTPDSFFSLDMDDFKELVTAVRRLEKALGDGIKICKPCEKGGLKGGRRCIYAAVDIPKGHVLTRGDLSIVRPNIGEIKPKHLSDVIGRRALCGIEKGRPLAWSHLK